MTRPADPAALTVASRPRSALRLATTWTTTPARNVASLRTNRSASCPTAVVTATRCAASCTPAAHLTPQPVRPIAARCWGSAWRAWWGG